MDYRLATIIIKLTKEFYILLSPTHSLNTNLKTPPGDCTPDFEFTISAARSQHETPENPAKVGELV